MLRAYSYIFKNEDIIGFDVKARKTASANVTITYWTSYQIRKIVGMRRECRERFTRHHVLMISTCITARAWRTYRDTFRDRQLAVSFEVGGEENLFRHYRRMRNPQFYASGKRPMGNLWVEKMDIDVLI